MTPMPSQKNWRYQTPTAWVGTSVCPAEYRITSPKRQRQRTMNASGRSITDPLTMPPPAPSRSECEAGSLLSAAVGAGAARRRRLVLGNGDRDLGRDSGGIGA